MDERVWKREDTATSRPIYHVLVNHWHHHGKGWQAGEESMYLSLSRCFEALEKVPGSVISQNFDAQTYELLKQYYPSLIPLVVHGIKTGKMEIVGGTYSQPHGSTIGSESNIRQFQFGLGTIKKIFGVEPKVFLEEEVYFFPQLPQILRECGYQYACLYFKATVTDPDIPCIDVDPFYWEGQDESRIVCVPKTHLCLSSTCDYHAALHNFAALFGRPLIIQYTETPIWRPVHTYYVPFLTWLVQEEQIKFTTLEGYLAGTKNPSRSLRLTMDFLNPVQMHFGQGGDQLRIRDRKLEGLLLAAESFDAVANTLGKPTRRKEIEGSWKKFLLEQGHGIHHQEYVTADQMNNLPKGTIAHHCLDRAEKVAKDILKESMQYVANRIVKRVQGDFTFAVFNNFWFDRDEILRIHLPVNKKEIKGIQFYDSQGQEIPYQILQTTRLPNRELNEIEVSFVSGEIPSFGWRIYYVKFSEESELNREGGIYLEERQEDIVIENEYLRMRIDKRNGSISSLFSKSLQKEFVDEKFPFHVIEGSIYPEQPFFIVNETHFSSKDVPCQVKVIAQGPLEAVIQISGILLTGRPLSPLKRNLTLLAAPEDHEIPLVTFISIITLSLDTKGVKIKTRIDSKVAPTTDLSTAYRMSFKPRLEKMVILRDYPFGIEKTNGSNAENIYGSDCTERFFTGLNFVDLTDAADGCGLQIIHSGSQLFKRDESTGIISNIWSRQMIIEGRIGGWPRIAEFDYSFVPHDSKWRDSDRVKESSAFNAPPLSIPIVDKLGEQVLSQTKGFISIDNPAFVLSAFRSIEEGLYELRGYDISGQNSIAKIIFAFGVEKVTLTNILGKEKAEIKVEDNTIELKILPYKIYTLRIYGKNIEH